MPIFKCLRRGGSDGTSSSTSGTLSEDSNEQQARKTRNVHLAFSILAGSVLCLSGYERGVLGAVGVGHGFQKTFGTPSALLGKTYRFLSLVFRYVPYYTGTTRLLVTGSWDAFCNLTCTTSRIANSNAILQPPLPSLPMTSAAASAALQHLSWETSWAGNRLSFSPQLSPP